MGAFVVWDPYWDPVEGYPTEAEALAACAPDGPHPGCHVVWSADASTGTSRLPVPKKPWDPEDWPPTGRGARTRWFRSDKFSPPAVMRRVGLVDEVFLERGWRPTTAIIEYSFGNDDFVTEISEVDARRLSPAAFDV